MNRTSFKEQDIREELENHIQEMVFDLVEQGIEQAAAEQQARAAFGDVDTAVEATLEVDGEVRWVRRPGLFALGIYVAMMCMLIAAMLVTAPGVVSSQIQVLLLWWVFVGITAVVLTGIHWVLQYTGMATMQGLRVSLLLILFTSLSITSVLDVDNFEVNVHAVLAAILVYIVAASIWKQVTVDMRRGIIFAFAALVVWTTLIEQPLFGFIGTARCLFLTADTLSIVQVPAECVRVPFLSRATAPLIILLLVGVPYVGAFVWKYWGSQATAISRKVLFTAGVVAMPVTPFIVTDVNNYGELDVIPWKADIYAAYEEVLGRSPEEKDIEFYAQTRAYENMDAVREVLYNSRERRLKINLLYMHYLGRSATTEEVDKYVQNRSTIADIIQDLESSN